MSIEIWLTIISFYILFDVHNFQLVCRFFRQIAASEKIFKKYNLIVMQITDKRTWYELVRDQMLIMISDIWNIFTKYLLENHKITLLKIKLDELKSCLMPFPDFIIFFVKLEVVMWQVGVKCLLRTKVLVFEVSSRLNKKWIKIEKLLYKFSWFVCER